MIGRRHLREQHPIGQVACPQDLVGPTVDNLHEALRGDPGLRLAETTGRATATYKGGYDIEVQRFHMPAGPNTAEDLNTAVISVNYPAVINGRRGNLPFGD